jgi:hypothetical protein
VATSPKRLRRTLGPDGWVVSEADTKRQLTADKKQQLAAHIKKLVEAEDEEIARKILGHDTDQATGEKRRGRPSGTKGKPLRHVLAEIEGRPLNELSKEQRQLAYRIGVDEKPKGRTQEEVAAIIRAVQEAKGKGHPMTLWPAGLKTSAFEVAGLQHNLSAEAVGEIWKRRARLDKKAKTYRI